LKRHFFMAMGQLAVVKCATKGLDYSHIFDYMALYTLKSRAYESVWLLSQINREKSIRNIKKEPPLSKQGTLKKMQSKVFAV